MWKSLFKRLWPRPEFRTRFGLAQLEAVVQIVRGRGREPDSLTFMTVLAVVGGLGVEVTAEDEGRKEIDLKRAAAKAAQFDIPAVEIEARVAVAELNARIITVESEAKSTVNGLKAEADDATERANEVEQVLGLLGEPVPASEEPEAPTPDSEEPEGDS